MINRTKYVKLLLATICIPAITVVVVLGIIKNPSDGSEYVSGTNLDDIINSRKTWDTAFTSWVGKDAPDFTVHDIEGNKHKLSDYNGRDVLVVFWATWCPACNMEIPHLIDLRNMLGEDKLAILAISNEPAELLKQFAAEKGINYKLISTGSSTLPAPFAGVSSIPTTFFIDRKGVIKRTAVGLVSFEEAKAIIQAR